MEQCGISMAESTVASVFVLDESTAVTYCASRGLIDPAAEAVVCPLSGGVSNTVIKVESGDTRIVLKQARAKLQVEADWFANRDRIWTEAAALRTIARWLPDAVPRVLDEDRANYIIALTCAPPSARSWKSQLLAGAVSCETAAAVGALLRAIHEQSHNDPLCADQFASLEAFDALRIDPYYRTVARVHPDLASHISALIERMLARRCTLVHGDYSPKNLLVDATQLLLIDCEVCHWGDPAFDTAFCLNHLLLKAQYRPEWAPQLLDAALVFWQTYSAMQPTVAADAETSASNHSCASGLATETTTIEHLGALMLARIDGKSPVEYICEEAMRARVRALARGLIYDPPATIAGVCARVLAAVEIQ
jgi:aminoglycoside phosphotransferase (APT) family kinase protein